MLNPVHRRSWWERTRSRVDIYKTHLLSNNEYKSIDAFQINAFMFPASFLLKCFPDIMRWDKWEKVFKNGLSKIFWSLSSTNFTWSILEYFFPNENHLIDFKTHPDQPILYHCFPSVPPENIRKSLVFWYFQGVQKEIGDMKWVKTSTDFSKKFEEVELMQNSKKRVRGGGLKDSS